MLTGEQLTRLYPYEGENVYGKDDPYVDVILKTAAEIYAESLRKQFVIQETEPLYLRPSLIGKPALEVLAHKYLPSLYVGTFPPRMHQVFKDGDTFESDYYTQLALQGVTFTDMQREIDWHGIPGKCDFLVDLDGTRVLLELKTCNDGYFQQMKGYQDATLRSQLYGEEFRDCEFIATDMPNYRGHISQASIYGEAINADEVVVVLKCKSTSHVLIYNVPHSVRDYQNSRSAKIKIAWDITDYWHECFYHVVPPRPKPEMSRGEPTGRMLISPAMYGSPIIPLVYKVEVIDKKRIVVGYHVPEECVEDMPDSIANYYTLFPDLYTYKSQYAIELCRQYQEMLRYNGW